jgi:hypothetical protein
MHAAIHNSKGSFDLRLPCLPRSPSPLSKEVSRVVSVVHFIPAHYIRPCDVWNLCGSFTRIDAVGVITSRHTGISISTRDNCGVGDRKDSSNEEGNGRE